MSGRTCFRVGSWILLALAMVHLIGHFQEPVAENDTERRLLALMTTHRKNMMGTMRSTMDLLNGFSLAFSIMPAGVALLNMMLGGRFRGDADMLRSAAAINTLLWGAMLVNSAVYWFAAPTVFLAAATLMFGLAWLRIRRSFH